MNELDFSLTINSIKTRLKGFGRNIREGVSNLYQDFKSISDPHATQVKHVRSTHVRNLRGLPSNDPQLSHLNNQFMYILGRDFDYKVKKTLMTDDEGDILAILFDIESDVTVKVPAWKERAIRERERKRDTPEGRPYQYQHRPPPHPEIEVEQYQHQQPDPLHTKFCPFCGDEIDRAVKYCPICGSKIHHIYGHLEAFIKGRDYKKEKMPIWEEKEYRDRERKERYEREKEDLERERRDRYAREKEDVDRRRRADYEREKEELEWRKKREKEKHLREAEERERERREKYEREKGEHERREREKREQYEREKRELRERRERERREKKERIRESIEDKKEALERLKEKREETKDKKAKKKVKKAERELERKIQEKEAKLLEKKAKMLEEETRLLTELKKCPNPDCKAKVDPLSEYCPKCGEEFDITRFCPKCGQQTDDCVCEVTIEKEDEKEFKKIEAELTREEKKERLKKLEAELAEMEGTKTHLISPLLYAGYYVGIPVTISGLISFFVDYEGDSLTMKIYLDLKEPELRYDYDHEITRVIRSGKNYLEALKIIVSH